MRITRRRFLRGLAGMGVAGAGTYGYAREIAVHAVKVERVTVPVAGLPQALEGRRVVVMSDFHAGPRASMEYLARAVDMAMALEPAFVLLPGDFVDSTLSHLEPLCRIFEGAAKDTAFFGSTGNHDFARDRRADGFSGKVCGALAQAGVRMLRNEVEVREGLCFVGLEDVWWGAFDAAVVERAPAGMPTIVLSHNPDSYDRVMGKRFDVMVSGHTHGGQVCIPGWGPLLLPVYHRERAAGLFHLEPETPQKALYVTRGVGHLLKVRLFCPPEITCITLVRAG
jgi:predicted MPP superfamily phosphohydrolase